MDRVGLAIQQSWISHPTKKCQQGSGKHREGSAMTDDNRKYDEEFWYAGKVTRRRLIGYGATAGALGATVLVPAPWRAAFGAEKPYKIGSEQPLSGPAAVGGKTAVVGLQMAVDRINHNGGINGRPVE